MPIQYLDRNVTKTGFENERNYTDFTRGFPAHGKTGAAITRQVPPDAAHLDIEDGMLVVVNSDGEAEKFTTAAPVIDPLTVPNVYFVTRPYKIFNGQYNDPSGLLTLLAENYAAASAQLHADEEFSTFLNNTHPITDTIVIDPTATVLDVTAEAASTLVIDGGAGAIDLEAIGLRIGDTFTLTAPATWDDDRDGGTSPEVASTQAAQTFTVTDLSTDTIEFDATENTHIYTPDGQIYTHGAGGGNDDYDGNFQADYTGGTVTFNRALADFLPGVALTGEAGLFRRAVAGEQIVGFVTGTDPLNRVLKFEPFKYRGV